MVQLGFNTQEYDLPTFGEPFKPGWYAARIDKIDLKPTKKGDGQYLDIQFVIDEAQHPDLAGRMVWDRLNVFHQNQKTMQIARGQMRKLQECVGKPTSQETDELLGLPVLVKVKLRAETAEFRAQNEIDDYKPIGATIPTGSAASAPATSASAPVAQTAGATPSTTAQVPAWMRK